MEFNLHDVAAASRAQNDLIVQGLLAWRRRMCAETGVPESAVAFIVPYDMLIGVTVAGGSQVIHSSEVKQPGVILPVPETW